MTAHSENVERKARDAGWACESQGAQWCGASLHRSRAVRFDPNTVSVLLRFSLMVWNYSSFKCKIFMRNFAEPYFRWVVCLYLENIRESL